MTKNVAILATGDEIINGDILNTNVQYIAQALTNANIIAGMQMTAADTQIEIETAMQFLLNRHDALITIGGLGPTSDDRTRFALSTVINSPLVFDQLTWDAIVERLKKYKLAIPESNRQQALFPNNAIIIPNSNGTAAGCMVKWKNKIIFMLPGPPHECYPMVDNTMIPALISESFSQLIFRKSWLLLGMSEGVVAEQLDAMMANTDCIVGYRASFPYVEVKLISHDEKKLMQLAEKFIPILQSHVVSENRKTASQKLQEFLQNFNGKLYIADEATGGLLQSTLVTPLTLVAYHFELGVKPIIAGAIYVQVTGLQNYWQQNSAKFNDELTMTITAAGESLTIKKPVIIRKQLTQNYAVEIICWELLKYLRQMT